MSPSDVTYKHLIAGSTFHFQAPKQHKDDLPNPVKTIQFLGKPGGIGYYSTSDAAEIAELDKIARNPQVQIERVAATLDTVLAAATPETDVIHKAQDPAVAAAAAEVTQQAAAASDPKTIAAAANLASMIAASKNK